MYSEKEDKLENGIRLRVFTPTQKRKGNPILCIHGMCADSDIFEPFAIYFARNGYEVFLPSLAGRENSKEVSDLGGYSLRDYADDLLDVFSCFTHPPIIMGHSMGGLIAQMLAAKVKSSRLVLLDSAPVAGVSIKQGLIAQIRQVKYLPAILFGKPVIFKPSDYKALIGNRLDKDANKKCVENLCYDSGKAMAEILFGKIEVDEEDVVSAVLVVCGSADRIIPQNVGVSLANKYKAGLKIYDRGHMLIIEEGYEEIATDIRLWLEG